MLLPLQSGLGGDCCTRSCGQTNGFSRSASPIPHPSFPTLQPPLNLARIYLIGERCVHYPSSGSRPENGCHPRFPPPLPHPDVEPKASAASSTSTVALGLPSPTVPDLGAHGHPVSLVLPSVTQLCSLPYCQSNFPNKFLG